MNQQQFRKMVKTLKPLRPQSPLLFGLTQRDVLLISVAAVAVFVALVK